MPWFHRVRPPVACLLLAVVLPACVIKTWQSVPADQVIAQETLPPRLRLTTSDGARVELESAVHQHDSIVGFVAAIQGWAEALPAVGTQTTIAKGDVVRIELKQMSESGTFGATLAVPFALILALGCVSFWCRH